MMESLSKKENIMKDIRNLFRLIELDYTAIKDIRNLFRLEKKAEAIKDTERYFEMLRIFLCMEKKIITNR